MASRLFGTGNTANCKYFNIRLDQSTLVLRGNEEEASSVLLKGTLVLCLAEPLKVQNVRLRFTGERRVGCGGQKKDDQFLRKYWSFEPPGLSRGGTLAADNYEWHFDYVLPGSTPESVEGLDDSWIVYRMKATIDRGILAQNIITRKHIRVVRTLDTAALELFHEMRVDNTWHDKIDYTLSTPTKGVIFGTTVDVNFRIASLLKGLKIGEVNTSLVETQDIWIDPKYPERKKGTFSRPVAEDKFDFPQDQETELVDGHDAWVFSRRLTLPKSLRQCLQTVDTMGIQTKHTLNFHVNLINPDEHVSKLTASLPVQIYISPALLMAEDNTISTDHLCGVNPGAFAVGAPPQYGQHRSDLLYSDLDPAGYVTPAGNLSGFNTPYNSQSRRGSSDNLAALALASTTASFTPIALQSRLNNLDNATSADRTSSHAPNNSSSSENPSATLSRQVSDESTDPCSPQHFEYSPKQMNKVPSYSTALRSQHQTPINEVPPIYQPFER
ncbi:MAG: hypothetical protein L6R36_006275 [Xanthoria steineri]|nr:MAG: hypothetical protein L6R36_006275 [Xanthoria steineri]